MRKLQLLSLALLIALLLIAIVPASAAPGATINSISVNAANCTMTLTFTVQDQGVYYLNAWDDGTFMAGAGVHVLAGGTATATLNIGPVLQGAAGIGLYVENALGPAATVTFDSDGSFQPNAPACVGTWTVSFATGPCLYQQPSNFVMRPVPNGATAYFAPAADKLAGFTLPAGTWYTSPEPVDGYYQVFVACPGSMIYIPVESVG